MFHINYMQILRGSPTRYQSRKSEEEEEGIETTKTRTRTRAKLVTCFSL
jgi:hypothetical protein